MKHNQSKKKCGKLAYPTKEAARKALKEFKHCGVKRFYLCPYCKVYHLTSESRKKHGQR